METVEYYLTRSPFYFKFHFSGGRSIQNLYFCKSNNSAILNKLVQGSPVKFPVAWSKNNYGFSEELWIVF